MVVKRSKFVSLKKSTRVRILCIILQLIIRSQSKLWKWFDNISNMSYHTRYLINEHCFFPISNITNTDLYNLESTIPWNFCRNMGQHWSNVSSFYFFSTFTSPFGYPPVEVDVYIFLNPSYEGSMYWIRAKITPWDF